ncbi:MAG TPA: DUF2075 domain-containing protein [Candidatus Cybelea sp.]
MQEQAAGWHGSVSKFISQDGASVVDDLRRFVSFLHFNVEEPQQRAWTDSVRVLKRELRTLVDGYPATGDWGLILEYELPREMGRRPDALLLTGDSVQVLEFKNRRYADLPDVDQLKAYARDLQEYHGATHDVGVLSVLSLDDAPLPPERHGPVWIVGGRNLSSCLDALAKRPPSPPPNIKEWLNAEYVPLPSLVASARSIFEHEDLPRIKRAESAGIPQALDALRTIAEHAKDHDERHIAFVTGVPGAGKTLLGLQFVYRTSFSGADRPALLLSGNGPLVDVLQHALKSKVFVQPVHGFLKQYGGHRARLPTERIWVYDEAQRAWDSDRVREKRGHEYTEHQDLIRLGDRTPDWAVILGLIGEGQEINVGEEGGVALWREAIAESKNAWVVHCPAHIAHHFDGFNVRIDEALNLTTSLRSHRAGDVHRWVRATLDGRLREAATVARALREAIFDLYVTRDIDEAKAYVRLRYAGDPKRRYGLLGSSKAKHLPRYGVNTDWMVTKSFRPGPWYNDPASSSTSSCAMLETATEFSCQGLELDFAIVGWDDDLLWDGVRWQTSRRPHKAAKDARQLRINSYRVLLTRGRDGMIIFVPPVSELDATYEALIASGAQRLEFRIAVAT